MSIGKLLYRHYINSSGLKSAKKIISIESDDWGSIRIPNKKVYNTYEKQFNFSNCPYSRYDGLETADDIHTIAELFYNIELQYGVSPVMTLNFLSGNPDFIKIRQDNFEKYHVEKVKDTYLKYDGEDNALKYITGKYKRFFDPQFHGREHINPEMWLRLLKKDSRIKLAFENDFFAFSYNNLKDIEFPYLASFMKLEEKDNFQNIIQEGLQIHKEVFGKDAVSFIAPVYIWNNDIEKELEKLGVNSVQGLYKRNEIKQFGQKQISVLRNNKNIRENNQIELVRNCFFEPATKNDYDWINQCLKDIEVAFKWNRPAIICSHRLNFSSRLDKVSRDRNISLFSDLLKQIIKNWPDVNFVDSDTLYNELKYG